MRREGIHAARPPGSAGSPGGLPAAPQAGGPFLLRLLAFPAALCLLPGCGVGGLIAGGIVGAVILTSDDDSSGSPPTAVLTSPPTRDALRRAGSPGIVPICYKLAGGGSQASASVEFSREADVFSIWREATPYSGDTGSYLMACEGAAFWWHAEADIDLQGKTESVRVRVMPRDDPRGADVSAPFLVGNTPPRVTFDEFKDSVGTIRIPLRAADDEGDPLRDVELSYQLPGEERWEAMAVLFPPGELSAPAGDGDEHTLVWSSKDALGPARVRDLKIRFRAADPFAEEVVAVSPGIEVNNNSRPFLADLVGPEGPEGHEIPISFQLVDGDDHILDAVIQYATGQEFPELGPQLDSPAYRRQLLDFSSPGASEVEAARRSLQVATPSSMRPGAREVLGLPAGPGQGKEHHFLWDTGKDLDPSHALQVRIRVTPFDPYERGFDRAMEITVDNDPFPAFASFVDSGGAVSGVALGDLNGDGTADVALSLPLAAPARVDVYLRDGLGSFPSAASLGLVPGESPEPGPRDLIIADVNRDGLADLIVLDSNCLPPGACQAAGDVSVFLGRRDEGEAEATLEERPDQVLRAGRDVRSMSLGNLDGSGGPDIAVSNHDSRTLSVFLSTPEGSYAADDPRFSVEFPVSPDPGERPREPGLIACADLDRDGLDEIIVREREARLVEIFRKDPGDALRWVGCHRISVDDPVSIATGHFDADEYLDLAVGIRQSLTRGNSISIFLNAAGGEPLSFTASEDVALASSPEHLAAYGVEVDGCAETELVALEPDSDLVELWRRERSGGWSAFKEIGQLDLPFVDSTLPSCVATGDVDGDGRADVRPDLLLGSLGGACLFRAEGAGSLAPRLEQTSSLGGSLAPQEAALTDFNGDGLTDLILAASDENRRSYQVLVYLQDRRGAIKPSDAMLVSRPNTGFFQAPVFLAVADRDGSAHLVAISRNKGVDVFRRSSDGFPAGPSGSLEDNLVAGPILLGEFDGQAGLDLLRLDVLGGSLILESVEVFGPDDPGGDGQIVMEVKDRQKAGSWPVSMAAGDLDGDQLTDVVVLEGTAGTIQVLQQEAPGISPRFQLRHSLPAKAGTGKVLVTHLDEGADLRPDIFLQAASAGLLSGYLQGAPAGQGGIGEFKAAFELDLARSPSDVAAGDLTGDGLPDIAVSFRGEPTVGVLCQAAKGGFGRSFAKGIDLGGDSQHCLVAVGDVTGDARPELVIVKTLDKEIKIVRTR